MGGVGGPARLNALQYCLTELSEQRTNTAIPNACAEQRQGCAVGISESQLILFDFT